MNSFDNNHQNTWCPGCGNFSILRVIKQALAECNLRPSQVQMISGIGQAAKLPHYMNAHAINGLHGRALPSAMGAIAANNQFQYIVTSGDGDTYGEGGNHFIHNVRRNLDLVHIVHDNQIYGLTKGQASPTTMFGQKTTLQIHGVRNQPLNPVALAISLDCSFVARGFTGNPSHLQELIVAAIEHKGYALIDVMQPCVSFNKVNTHKWYKDRVKEIGDDHDPTDAVKAFTLAQQFGNESIPIGILYRHDKPSFMDQMTHLTKPLISYERHPKDIVKLFDRHR